MDGLILILIDMFLLGAIFGLVAVMCVISAWVYKLLIEILEDK